MINRTETNISEVADPGSVLGPDDLFIRYDVMKLRGSCLIVTVAGEVTAANALQLDQAVDLPAGYEHIALDLRGVPLCDADGIITLLKIKRRAHNKGQDIRFVNLSQAVQRIIDVSGIKELLFESGPSGAPTAS